MKTLQEVDAYLSTLIPQSRSMGDRSAHTTVLLQRLGNPQNTIPAIHIAGTSGKGSTAYYSAAMLVAAGYSVGLAVSPHVSKVSERAQVNGSPLPDDEYVGYVAQFRDMLEAMHETVTYIEFLTVFAYWLFAKLALDYMVIEVGLGGRLDATNTITRPKTVRVITDIGLDHTEVLGDTVSKIAAEKAGIIHDGDSVCMHQQTKEVVSVIERYAHKHNATLTFASSKDIAEDPTHLQGYPHRNWLLAKEAVTLRLANDGHPQLDDVALGEAAQIDIPGRFEEINEDGVTVILDAAHNPQKMQALAELLRLRYPSKDIIGVISIGKNKQTTAKETLSCITPILNELIITEFSVKGDSSHQALDSLLLKPLRTPESAIIPGVADALQYARMSAEARDAIVVVTGSFYLVSNARDVLLRITKTFKDNPTIPHHNKHHGQTTPPRSKGANK